MLNKKILAVAVAASFSFNAAAAVTMATGVGALPIATESYPAATTAITLNGVAQMDLVSVVGAAYTAGGDKVFYRYELTNATFGDQIIAGDFVRTGTDTNANVAITVEFGGAPTDSFVVISITDADDNFLAADVTTLDIDDLDVTAAGTAVTAIRKVYIGSDAAINASNDIGTPFNTVTSNYISFVSGRTGSISAAPAAEVTALVANGFTTYDIANVATTTDTLTNLGAIDIAGAGSRTATAVASDDLLAIAAADVFDINQVVTLAGDFSFGTFSLNDAANCGGNIRTLTLPTLPLAQTSATTATADFTGAQWYLCSNIGDENTFVTATDKVPKVTSAYTFTLGDDALTGNLGTIGYDTTSIKIDYVTINPEYAQKIFLVNTGSGAASFTTSFTLEAGSTAAAGSGSVAAGAMVTIKASDFMTVTGTALRGSAVIEIEATTANVQATTQIINLTTKDTDTITLSVQ
jgi:hypothetical protein